MKKKNIFGLIVLMFVFIVSLPASSLSQGPGKGKGGPPSWAPAHGYRAQTRHVYFPEHNFYFDVQKGIYIYLSGGTWKLSSDIPKIFRSVDLKSTPKIELEIDVDNPQKFNKDHKSKYRGNSNSTPSEKQKVNSKGKSKGNDKKGKR
ncbi:MAG: hypothetical protein R3277_09705 [Brumimicrobium sp.]|nr:hypothetical protein [Brumimicrobium sp.]